MFSDLDLMERGKNERDNDFNLRIEIPSFNGSMSSEEFLGWLVKVKSILNKKKYQIERK